MLHGCGARFEHADVLINLGDLESLTGAATQARDHFDEALAIARRYGAPLDEARALEGLGRSHLRDHNRADGITCLRQALAIYQRIGAPNAQSIRQALHELESETSTRALPTTQ